MLKLLAIFLMSFIFFTSCSDSTQKDLKDYKRIINYFDSNRVKEFDTITFQKSENFSSYNWVMTSPDDKLRRVSYRYCIGFGDRFDEGYDFPAKDSIDRIWISDHANFNKLFPLKLPLPEKNIDLLLNKNGLIDCRISWMNNDYDEQTALLYTSLRQDCLFVSRNPFDYFRSRNKIMDSLGIFEAGNIGFASNAITIVLEPGEEILEYLPKKIIIDSPFRNSLIDTHFRRRLDSIISIGKRIEENWILRTRRKL